jgi:molecular chaperone GrpE
MTEDSNQNSNQEQVEETQENQAPNQVEELNKKIADLESVINNLNDKLLRSLADLDNVRRRSMEELEKASKYAVSNFASDLVVVAENFYLASDNIKEAEINSSPAFKHFADAMNMTKKELTKVLEKNGIKRIYPLGEQFDHNFHEAISRIESDEEDGVIKQVIQAGYSIGDRLIRPALVAVSVKA